MKIHSIPTINLKDDPKFTELHLQNAIADDPAILGLGPLVYIGRERSQVGSGRLDLLLSDEDDVYRYTVETQLGKTDPSHIIRLIEYWDLERRRNRGVDHIAVIIAEEITKRFFNVISILADSIPVIAMQTQAIRKEDGYGLFFSKIHDTAEIYYSSPETEDSALVSDRLHWIKRGSIETVNLADKVIEMIKSFVPNAELKYNRHYIGVQIDGKSNNFVTLRAQKSQLRIEPKVAQSEDIDSEIEERGLNIMDYDKRYGAYRLKIRENDLSRNVDFVLELLKSAYELREQP